MITNTIAECLLVHADTVERFGTARPELVDGSNHELIARLVRQRMRVAAALDGDDPEVAAKHVESLTKGMRIAARSRKIIHAG